MREVSEEGINYQNLLLSSSIGSKDVIFPMNLQKKKKIVKGDQTIFPFEIKIWEQQIHMKCISTKHVFFFLRKTEYAVVKQKERESDHAKE
jgi:hypothetical protein